MMFVHTQAATYTYYFANLLFIRGKKNQLMYNLFLLYFFSLYMFRAYLGHLSGGTTVWIRQLVLTVLFRRLSVVQGQYAKSKLCIKLDFLYTIISRWTFNKT